MSHILDSLQPGDVMYYNQERFEFIKHSRVRYLFKRDFMKYGATVKLDGNDMYICLQCGKYVYVDPLEVAFLKKSDLSEGYTSL